MSIPKRIGATAGFATPIVAFTCILTAIATYPEFSWTNNALSDLGVVSGITGPLFNTGLVVSGALGIVFAVLGIRGYVRKSWVGKLGAWGFAAASLALVFIGVFNESFGNIHYIVSVAFFSLAPIALFILTCSFYLHGNHGLGAFTIVVGLVMAVPWILQLTMPYVSRVAIPETISAVTVSIWAIVLSAEILRNKTAKQVLTSSTV